MLLRRNAVAAVVTCLRGNFRGCAKNSGQPYRTQDQSNARSLAARIWIDSTDSAVLVEIVWSDVPC
eukprot:4736298-Amphidinium_carterae.3